jgi:hypothetical protein
VSLSLRKEKSHDELRRVSGALTKGSKGIRLADYVEGAVTMPLLVTSAADANGNGYGALLAFDLNARAGGSEPALSLPKGLAVSRSG